MRIVLDLDCRDTPDGVSEYVKAGAEEFRAVMVPPAWLSQWGWEEQAARCHHISMQFTDYRHLGMMMEQVHRLGKRIYIGLDALEYSREQIPVLQEMIRYIERHVPDAWTIAHPGTMMILQESDIDTSVHVDAAAGCFNLSALKYFLDAGNVTRICLPRDISLGEIQEHVQSCRDHNLECEIIGFGRQCRFASSRCLTQHSLQAGPFCDSISRTAKLQINAVFPSGWHRTVENIIRNPQGNEEDGAFNHFLMQMEAQMAKWQDGFAMLDESNCAEPCNPHGIHSSILRTTLGRCSLCLLETLRDVGVTTVRVGISPGRPEIKTKWVSNIAKIIRDHEADPRLCMELVASPGFCKQAAGCCYKMDLEE